jgi:S1-C subfamily serine protease
MKLWFRRFIDGAVIVLVIVWLWPYAEMYLPYEYIDEVTPDEVLALDEEVNLFLPTVESNFQELYANPRSLSAYRFRYLEVPILLRDQENYAESIKSIVYITTEDITGMYIGTGSILTEDGVILTNHHLIDGADRVVVATTDGDLYPVTAVLASDELLDITFLKIDASGLSPLPIGDSNRVVIGDKTLVIGHGESFINTLSLGNVSGIRSYHTRGGGKQMQITNPISLGNSGGAVLNEYGEIIGIPTWSLEYDYNIVQVQNLNFAIPINEALAVLEQ